MLKWSFNFMSMKSIPLLFYESSISKIINTTSFLKKMQLAMHKTAPDIKNINVQFINNDVF